MFRLRRKLISLSLSTSIFILSICILTTLAKADTLSMIEQHTGNHQETGYALGNNTSGAKVFGTDLGIPYFDSYLGFMFYAFGDTFRDDDGPEHPDFPMDCSGVERCYQGSNVVGYSYDMDPASGGIDLHGFLSDPGQPSEGAKQAVAPYDGYSAIPISGFSDYVNGHSRHFLWVMDIRWDPYYISGGRLIYSDDLWYSEQPALLSVGNSSNFVMGNMMYRDDDDYVYIFGTKAYRVYGGVKLARIPRQDLLNGNISALRYYKRANSSCYDSANWTTSTSSLTSLFTGYTGEASVTYNSYLGKYLILYFDSYYGTIRKRTSTTVCGSWSSAVSSVPCTSNSNYYNCYGSYMIPKYTVVNNKMHYYTDQDVYFIMSRMTPAGNAAYDGCESGASPCHNVYNTFLMKLHLVK